MSRSFSVCFWQHGCDDNDYYVHVNCFRMQCDTYWFNMEIVQCISRCRMGTTGPMIQDGIRRLISVRQIHCLELLRVRKKSGIRISRILHVSAGHFTLNGADHMILDFDADDDAIVYINGVQVNNDFDCNISVVKGIDITSYLDWMEIIMMAVGFSCQEIITSQRNCTMDISWTVITMVMVVSLRCNSIAPSGQRLVETILVRWWKPTGSTTYSVCINCRISWTSRLYFIQWYITGPGQVYDYRYVDHVIAFSSEYTTDYGSAQIIGPPSIYPTYGDNATAWAPLTKTINVNSSKLVLQLLLL